MTQFTGTVDKHLPPASIHDWIVAQDQRRRDVLHDALYRPVGMVRHLNSLLALNHSPGYGPTPRPCDLPLEDRQAISAFLDVTEAMLAQEIAELRLRLDLG